MLTGCFAVLAVDMLSGREGWVHDDDRRCNRAIKPVVDGCSIVSRNWSSCKECPQHTASYLSQFVEGDTCASNLPEYGKHAGTRRRLKNEVSCAKACSLRNNRREGQGGRKLLHTDAVFRASRV